MSGVPTPKPVPADVQPDGIPAELKQRPQWCLWRHMPDGKGGWTKEPFQPNGRHASSTNSRTWSTFGAVWQVYERGGFDGIGYVFSGAPDDYVGIDLDHVRDRETGSIRPWTPDQRRGSNGRWTSDAPEPSMILAELQTYTEVSPSETGLKLWVKGSFPISGSKSGDFEAYKSGRYFCTTGMRFADAPRVIADCDGQVWGVCSQFLGAAPVNDSRLDDLSVPRTDAVAPPEDDAALIEAILANGEDKKFSSLWKGDWKSFGTYSSQSSADQALANKLVFYSDGDSVRADRLFRQSALMRPKWDSRRGEETYGQRTLQKAKKAYESKTKDKAVVRNYRFVPKKAAGDAKAKLVAVPCTMGEIIGTIKQIVGDWPRRVDTAVFVHDMIGKPDEPAVDWLGDPSAFFGFLQSRGRVDWRTGNAYVTKAETFAEFRRAARAHLAVEVLPHEPLLPGHYYCSSIDPGDGRHLQWLLDRFNPETPLDRDLIQAALLTPFWGGRGGTRPVFVVTSDDGRGAGKSKVAEMIGHTAGGTVDFSANEDFVGLKTRLLSPDAITKRVATLDNLKSLRFSWAEFEGLVTAPMISGRRLYVGEASRPNTITWFITLNGASLSTDMAQRSVLIKIKKPKRSATWEEETVRYVLDNQLALIGDIIAALRSEPFTLARYSRWASWEKDVLSRLADPSEAQALIAERQAVVDVEQEESDIIEDFFATQLRKLGYDAERDIIHVPVAVAARWFNWATGEKRGVTGASTTLKQMSKEGKLRLIQENPSRARGRGFLWSGEFVDVEDTPRYDLADRFAQLNEKETSTVD